MADRNFDLTPEENSLVNDFENDIRATMSSNSTADNSINRGTTAGAANMGGESQGSTGIGTQSIHGMVRHFLKESIRPTMEP